MTILKRIQPRPPFPTTGCYFVTKIGFPGTDVRLKLVRIGYMYLIVWGHIAISSDGVGIVDDVTDLVRIMMAARSVPDSEAAYTRAVLEWFETTVSAQKKKEAP